ncbi:MAG: hypothetical protein AXA67_09325 [Methylothermaceae bacteria B42]|nr:MAG: hypothetical protein AXA67_09325 [Methylothermaceae bacteria B42]HHJ39506.1 HDOD domain-containing protein [Methylothermaceae bacterium]
MLKRFLNKDKSRSDQQRLVPSLQLTPRPLTVAELKQLIPLRNFSNEELEAFALSQTTETYGPGSILFERGESEDHVFYLLSGTVIIKSEEGQEYEITAGSAKSRFPLSSGKTHNVTAISKTDIEVIRTSSRVMHRNVQDIHSGDDLILNPENWNIPETLANSQLFQAFSQHFSNEELKLPTLPDVAVRLRKAVQKEDIGVAEAAKIVQLDATIATKLLHIANSPLYMAVNPAKNCLEAVSRLGLKATCSLVLTLCMKDLFKSEQQQLREKFKNVWKESLHIAALSYVLAKDNQWRDPEEALLAGLINDIGKTAFLAFVDNFPQSHYEMGEVDAALPVIRGPVGYYILKKWDFAEELAKIPLFAESWLHDSGDDLSLSDIIMLSKLHRAIELKQISELPPINTIPACRKLRDGELSPEYSLKVLHQAKAQINEALSFLR